MDRIGDELCLFVLAVSRVLIVAPIHFLARVCDAVVAEVKDTYRDVMQILLDQ
jgi:hypothetical protein